MTRTGRPLAMPAEDRKKHIFQTAEQLFCARGYEKVTMSEIAAEAGMSKKTLYVYFADKEALLTSLVASSYTVAEPEVFGDVQIDPVDALKQRLRMITKHVLSARHLRLYRLAIGESLTINGLTDTFYQMGIQASRASLIQAIEHIPSSRRIVSLESDILADMLFGATVGKVLIDALLAGASPDLTCTNQTINAVCASLFLQK